MQQYCRGKLPLGFPKGILGGNPCSALCSSKEEKYAIHQKHLRTSAIP